MILVLEDDGCVHVYQSIDEVILQVEGLDAEDTLRAVFDDQGQRFAIRWLVPNKKGRDVLGFSIVENGKYVLEPDGARDVTALLEALNGVATILPGEREPEVRDLRDRLARA